MEDLTVGASLQDFEHGVERRKPADPAGVTLVNEDRGEGTRVTGCDGLKEPLIGNGGLLDGSGVRLEGVAVAGTDVSQIYAGKETDWSFVSLDSLLERLHHDTDRFDALLYLFHAEGTENRDDTDLREKKPEKEGLELDGMLPAVSKFVKVKIKRGAAAKLVHESGVHRHRPEGRFEVLSGKGKVLGEGFVAGSQDDAGTDRGCLDESLVGVGEAGSAGAEIDMRRYQPEEPPPGSVRLRVPGSTTLRGEEPQELSLKLVRVGLVTGSGEEGRPPGTATKLGDNLFSIGAAPVVFQKKVSVELADELVQLLSEEDLAELAHVGGLDVHQGVRAVHESDQEIRLRAEDDRFPAQPLLVLKHDMDRFPMANRDSHQVVSQFGLFSVHIRCIPETGMCPVPRRSL
jgi:hypothetical protein